jgi:serine/threonine protein phosphatase PrpC
MSLAEASAMNQDEQPASFKYCEAEMTQAQFHPLAGGTAAVFTTPAPDKTGGNEDAAILIPVGENACVLAVADGVGGMRAGAQASGIAVERLRTSVSAVTGNGQSLRDAILNGIEEANREILELGIGASTTLAVVEIQNHEARSYHVGDSMILVVGQRGRLKLQTIPHSPVGYALESGYLEEDEAMHHVDRHIVSNMLGSAEMRIEIGPVLKLAAYDTLLLASDGLADNLHVEEIVESIRKGRLPVIVRQIIARVRERMVNAQGPEPSKADDLTFIVYRRARN